MGGRYCHVEIGRTGQEQVWGGEIRTSALGHARLEMPLDIQAVMSNRWFCIGVQSPVEKPVWGI